MAEETTSNGSVIPEVPAFNTENGGGVAATAPESIQPVKIELSCTIGEKLAFTKFIKELRDMLAKHPGEEDICGDGQEDKNLSSCKKHPLLAKPRADQQPARWIHIKLEAVKENETWSTTLVMRDDNVDVMGFINQNGHLYELGYRRTMLPPQFTSSVLLGWGNSYKSILAARNVEEVMNGLVSAKLGKTFATRAVRVLSRFRPDVADDGDNPNPRLAVVGLMFMVSESARMNPVHDAIARGWDTGTGFNRELMTDYVWKYEDMSRRLRQWKRGNYAEQRPNSELRDIYLVLNVGFTMIDAPDQEMLEAESCADDMNCDAPAESVEAPAEVAIGDEPLTDGRLSYTIEIKGRQISPRFAEFTVFIKALRVILADHQDSKDICHGHQNPKISSCREHPLLPKPQAEQPVRWIRLNLQVAKGKETSSTSLLMSYDNVDIMAFSNQDGIWYELGYSQMLHNSVLLGWGNSYKSILKAKNAEVVMNELVRERLGKTFATRAVRVLSRFRPDVVHDGDNPRLAVVGLMFIVSESARMNPVHDAIARGWTDGTGFTRELMEQYVWKYVEMSRRLRHWKSGNYAGPQPVSELRDVYLVLNVRAELVYTIGDEITFLSFMTDLRRLLADHREKEDILGGHTDSNLSKTGHHPVLPKQRAVDEQPGRWIHVTLQAVKVKDQKTSWTTLFMRDDNMYVCGFMNQQGDSFQLLDEHKNASNNIILPITSGCDAKLLGWGVSYSSMLGTINSQRAAHELEKAHLGRNFAEDAVRALSSYGENQVVADTGLSPRVALAGLIVIVCESARLNPPHDSIARTWSTGIGFSKQLMTDYLWKHGNMSRTLWAWKIRGYESIDTEQGWLPHPISELQNVYLVLNSIPHKDQAKKQDNKVNAGNDGDSNNNRPSNTGGGGRPPGQSRGGHNAGGGGHGRKRGSNDRRNWGPQSQHKKGRNVRSDGSPASKSEVTGDAGSSGEHDSKSGEASDADSDGGPASAPNEAGDDTGSSGGGSASQPGESGDPGSSGGSPGEAGDAGSPSGGNSGSQPRELVVRCQGHGRPRVELLAIHADLRVKGTEIIVFDGKRGQIIYRKEEGEQEEQKKQREQEMVELVLTGPYTGISAYGCFAIKIQIPPAAASSSSDDSRGLIKWEWNCYDPKYAEEVDKPPVPRTISSLGPGRNVKVTYAVMSNALEATVQVKLWLKGRHPSDVSGEITAHNDGFEDEDRSLLFRRASGMGPQCLSSTNDGLWLLDLARNVVAVPCGRVLRIAVNLHVETKDGEEIDVKVPLSFDNGICSSKTDDGKEVRVEVNWYPEISLPSHPSDQITSKVADEENFLHTAPSEQSGLPEIKRSNYGKMISGHQLPEIVYTIGDELSYTYFIKTLRPMLADHPDREDIMDRYGSSVHFTGEHPVLPKQRAEQPARWIHIKLQAKKGEEMMSTTLLMRDDNLYVCGFINQQGELFELIDNHNRSTNILPVNEYKARRLSWGGSYRSLLEADTEDDLVDILTREDMGCDFMTEAMYVLSRFPAWVDDHMNPRSYGKQMNPRMALAGLIVMVCESARMNPIHNFVKASWWSEDRPYNMLDRRMWDLTHNYVSNYYGWTSRELLTWKSKGYTNPHPKSGLQDIYLALNYRLEPPPQAGGAESSRRTQGTTPQRQRWMAGDAKDHGRPRVEVLAMRADIGVIGTTVMVFDGKRGHIIYKDEQGKQGMADLVLTGPCKSISAYGCFAIKIDIPPGAAVGSSRKGDADGSIKWEWDCYDQEYRKEVDKPPVTRTINRNVEVTYAVMSEAFEATVQVKMMRLRDGNSTGIVHGNITARIGDLKDDYKEPLEEKDYYKEEIILFKRTEEMGQHFSPTDSRVLQLSRSIIAVPHWLLIKIDLQIETSSDNQQRLKPQPFNTPFEFKSGIWSQRRHEVDGNEVEVTVTWYPHVSTEGSRGKMEIDISYMAGGSGEGFSAFITELRRLVADHPHRMDVLEEHPGPVRSSTRNHPVLPASGLSRDEIRRWLLHIKLHAGSGVETPSITLAMRADTLEILGFKNQNGHWWLLHRSYWWRLPEEYNAQSLDWGETYRSILGVGSWKEIIDILNSKVLGKTFIADAVSSLSHYGSTQVKAGSDDPKLALVGLMVMVCESAKFNSVHDEIVRSWEDGTGLTEQLMGYIKNWREMSTALLDWKDHIYQGWPRNEKLEKIEIKIPDDALDKIYLVCNDQDKRFATKRYWGTHYDSDD